MENVVRGQLSLEQRVAAWHQGEKSGRTSTGQLLDDLLGCLNGVVVLLDGKEWSPDTLDLIAVVLRANGFEIRGVDNG